MNIMNLIDRVIEIRRIDNNVDIKMNAIIISNVIIGNNVINDVDSGVTNNIPQIVLLVE